MKKMILAAMSAMAILFSSNAQTPDRAIGCCNVDKVETSCCKDAKADKGCCKEGKTDKACCKDAAKCDKAACDKKAEGCCKKGEGKCDKTACDKKAEGCCKKNAELNPCAMQQDACTKRSTGVKALKVSCPKDTATVISTESLSK